MSTDTTEEDEEREGDPMPGTKDEVLKLWVFTVILHPTKHARYRGEVPKIIVGLNAVMAKDEADAAIQIGPQIPEEYRGLGDRVEVSVRPF